MNKSLPTARPAEIIPSLVAGLPFTAFHTDLSDYAQPGSAGGIGRIKATGSAFKKNERMQAGWSLSGENPAAAQTLNDPLIT